MGKLRDDIMKNCPEEFEEELKNFIDTVESIICSAINEMRMDSIDDIYNIKIGYNTIRELAEDLY